MPDDTSTEPPVITRNLLTIVCRTLEERGQPYTELNAHTVQLAIGEQRGIYTVYITADDARDYVRVLCYLGSRVPVDRRGAVAEALTRINYVTRIGSFAMDFADGEVLFGVSVDVEDGLLSAKMVDNMIGVALWNMERYHEPLMRIAFGDADPETALVEVP